MNKAKASGLLYQRAYVWGEDGTMYITHQMTHVMEVKRIVDMMAKLIRSKGPLFQEWEKSGKKFVHRTRLGDSILLCMKADLRAIDEHFPRHRHSPLYTLFKRFFGRIQMMGQGMYPEELPLVNEAIAKVRAFAKGKALGVHLKDLKRSERKNAVACKGLLDDLRKGYSKILALRVDFGYISTYCPHAGFRGQAMTFEQAKVHRDKLLKYVRKGPYSKHLSGYMWKMEYGFEKGYHFHMAFFFDGQQLLKDISIADAIGAYWRNEVTEGKGMYFNCNKKKEAYENCGIGMVNRTDDSKWVYLEEAMRYLTKVDLYLRFRAGTRARTFGCSNGAYGGIKSPPQQPFAPQFRVAL